MKCKNTKNSKKSNNSYFKTKFSIRDAPFWRLDGVLPHVEITQNACTRLIHSYISLIIVLKLLCHLVLFGFCFN